MEIVSAAGIRGLYISRIRIRCPWGNCTKRSSCYEMVRTIHHRVTVPQTHTYALLLPTHRGRDLRLTRQNRRHNQHRDLFGYRICSTTMNSSRPQHIRIAAEAPRP